MDRLTFGGNIIETDTDSYRLAHTRARADQAPRELTGPYLVPVPARVKVKVALVVSLDASEHRCLVTQASPFGVSFARLDCPPRPGG